MEKNKRYQIIGAHVKPQAVSFDDELEKIAGIFYEISFEHDFTSYCIDGKRLIDMSADRIIELIKKAETNYEFEDTTAYWSKMATINNDVPNIVYAEKTLKKLIAKEERRIKRFMSDERLQAFWDDYYEEV